jgi:hypothetical protein
MDFWSKLRAIQYPLMRKLETASQAFKEYHNNLDSLLGIHTLPMDKCIDHPYTSALILTRFNQLYISQRYDWYIVDKHPGLDMFKVVGLNKTNTKLNKVYILGRTDEGDLLLRSRPTIYIERPFSDDWDIDH